MGRGIYGNGGSNFAKRALHKIREDMCGLVASLRDSGFKKGETGRKILENLATLSKGLGDHVDLFPCSYTRDLPLPVTLVDWETRQAAFLQFVVEKRLPFGWRPLSVESSIEQSLEQRRAL